LTLSGPVIAKSGEVFPQPGPVTGSLLATEATTQVGLGSHVSVAEADTWTGTNLWFGGHRTFGLAERAEITGGVVSFTVTVAEH